MPIFIEHSEPALDFELSLPARLIQLCTYPAPQKLVFTADLNWQSVLALVRYNQIVPLAYARLSEYAAAVPPEVLQLLKAEATVMVGWNLKLAGELLTILKLLQASGIQAVPFKGPAFISLLYGSLRLRQTRDLDIFVERSRMSQAVSLLQTIGYELDDEYQGVLNDPKLSAKHKDVLVVNRLNGVNMDIHWAVCEPDFDRSLAAANLWSSGVTTTLLGEQVPVPSPENVFLLLVIHGARHHWNSLRLLCDIAWLLNTYPDLDFEVVARKMSGLWRTRMLLVPLAIVRNLWNLALPPWISVLIDSDLKVQEQASAISSGLFAVTVDSDLSKKAAEILLLQQSLRLDSSSGRRERFQLLIDAFKRLVLPNELDRQFLALPRQLSVIYYFARPIRILRTYGFGLCLGAARKLWQTIAG